MLLSGREREALLAVVESEAAETPPPRGGKWPDRLAEAAFIGPAGEFVRTVEPHTESDPAGLLLQFLAGVGCMMGRHAHFRAEADQHYPNLFVALVGNSSQGRKGTSWAHVRSVMDAVDPDFTHHHVMGGLSSGEGIVWHLRDVSDDDSGVDDKRLLLVETEFSSVLRVMSRDGNTLSSMLRQAWDGAPLRILTKNSPVKATDTHVSLISHISRSELLRYLNNTECANGFGNRFLWACVKRSKLLPEGGSLPKDALNGVFKEVRQSLEFTKTREEIERDAEAREMWIKVYSELTADQPGLLGSILARTAAQTMRLALIYSLLDCSQLIQRRHLEAALAVMDFVTASAEWIFGELYGDADADKILSALREISNGLRRTEISNLFGRHKPQREIEAALATLEHGQLAYRRSESTGGRSVERWYAKEK